MISATELSDNDNSEEESEDEDEDTDQDLIQDEDDKESDNELVDLRHGECLDLDECSETLRAYRSRVIAVVGPRDSGKTSLIAALYELLQMPNDQGFSFARSRTLIAFERALHDSRVVSGRAKGTIERTGHSTKPGGVVFYHLGLHIKKDAELMDLLLADRAGEEYNSAKDEPLSVKFAEIQRADTVTLLVDAERLIDSALRHDHLSDISLVIQALLEAGLTSKRQKLLIVLTKKDMIDDSSETVRTNMETIFSKLVKKLIRLYESHFSEIISFQVAALPGIGSSLPIGFGLDKLVEEWLLTNQESVADSPRVSPKRAFSRFTSG